MTELPDNLPRHVAIIMDGNGRWARQRGLPRVEGHRAGFETARSVAECCRDWHIPILTLYAFSTENWKRPAAEVRFLMSNLRKFLRERREEFVDKDVSLRAVGELDGLPKDVQSELRRTIRATAEGNALTVVLALNYGARLEIVEAARQLARKARDGGLDPDQIDEEIFKAHLWTADLPDPDLMIRTGGERRLSNFLLWQLQYSELYVTDTYWPDFAESAFLQALQDYAGRERRFGGLKD
jgi:undecaprenyl diphosphate synthase